jgi:hypothetical protein
MTTTSDKTQPLPGSTLLETCAKNLLPIPAIIPGLLYHGHTICAGPPKSGKSFLATQLAFAVASGEPALGCLKVERRGPVLYLALEDGERRMKARTGEPLAGATPPWLGDIRVIYELPSPLDTKPGLDWLDDLLKRGGYELLVIDTYVKAFPSESRSSDLFKGQYKQMDKLTGLARKHDFCVFTNAHARKPGKDEDGSSLISVAGTGGMTAAVDAVLMLQGKGKAARLNVISRDTEAQTLVLKRTPPTVGWVAVPPTASLAQAQLSAGKASVLEVLTRKGPLTRSEVEAELPEAKSGSVGTWLYRLEQDQLVVKRDGGRYGLPEVTQKAVA